MANCYSAKGLEQDLLTFDMGAEEVQNLKMTFMTWVWKVLMTHKKDTQMYGHEIC